MQAPLSRRVLLAVLGWRSILAVGFGGLIGLLGGLWKSPLSYGVLAAALLLRFVLDRRQWASKSFWDQAPLLLFFPLFALVATHSLNFELEQPLGLASSCFGLGLIAAMIVWTKAPLPRAFPLSAVYALAATAGALVAFQFAFHFRALDVGTMAVALLLAVVGGILGGGLRTFAELFRRLPKYYFWKHRFWKYYAWARDAWGQPRLPWKPRR